MVKSYTNAALKGCGKSYTDAALRGFGDTYTDAALRGFGDTYTDAALRGFGRFWDDLPFDPHPGAETDGTNAALKAEHKRQKRRRKRRIKTIVGVGKGIADIIGLLASAGAGDIGTQSWLEMLNEGEPLPQKLASKRFKLQKNK